MTSGSWLGRCEVAHESDLCIRIECPHRSGGHLPVASVRPPLSDGAFPCDRAALSRCGDAAWGWLEVLFIAASVAMATGSLCWGFRRHRRWRALTTLSAALTMTAVGRILASEPHEHVCIVVGAVVPAGGHLLNRYLCLTHVV